MGAGTGPMLMLGIGSGFLQCEEDHSETYHVENSCGSRDNGARRWGFDDLESG